MRQVICGNCFEISVWVPSSSHLQVLLQASKLCTGDLGHESLFLLAILCLHSPHGIWPIWTTWKSSNLLVRYERVYLHTCLEELGLKGQSHIIECGQNHLTTKCWEFSYFWPFSSTPWLKWRALVADTVVSLLIDSSQCKWPAFNAEAVLIHTLQDLIYF